MSGLVPVHDLDAEAAVLSACILSPDAFVEISPNLKGIDFFSQANRHIYEAIVALDAENTPADAVTVAQKLKSKDRLRQVGGPSYLAQILNATPAVANVAAHARRVAELGQVRRLQKVCQRVAAEGYSAIENIGDWLSAAEGDVFHTVHEGNGTDDTLALMADVARAEYDVLCEGAKARKDSSEKPRLPGLSTGLRDLDHILQGLKSGNLYVLAGRPGMGKSALASKIASAVAVQGKAVVIISAEMPKEQLGQRRLAQEAGIPIQRIVSQTIFDDEWSRLASALERIHGAPVTIEDRPGPTLLQIRAAVRRSLSRLREKHGQQLELGLVVVDYLGILGGERQRGDSREREVAELSKGHMHMAKEFKAPVLLLSQLNRGVENRENKRPRLADLRDSGSVEQDAYCVMFVYREDRYRAPHEAKDSKAEIIVAKHRNGGEGTANVLFHGESTLFYDEPEPEGISGDDYDDVADEDYAA